MTANPTPNIPIPHFEIIKAEPYSSKGDTHEAKHQ